MIILCGKTASGKDTVAKELIKLGIERLVTYTSRPMRKGEENGVEYWFFSEDNFKTLEKEGVFLETTSYTVADGKTWYYGTPVLGMDTNKVVIMNPDGVRKILDYGKYNPVIFYLHVDEEVLKERLKLRGDNEEESHRRLTADNADFSNMEQYYDFKIDNTTSTPEETAFLIYQLHQNCCAANKQLEKYFMNGDTTNE